MSKLAVGFIVYGENAVKYLTHLLPSLKEQTHKGFDVLCLDNNEAGNNPHSEYIKNNHPEIDYEWSGKNLGFARGHNRLIRKAIEGAAEYYLALNTDMVFSPDMIEKMVAAIEGDGRIGAVQPRILRWDFERNIKTNTIDSLGTVMDDKFRFFDYGQGREAQETGEMREIFGFTGAAVLFRLSALKDTAFRGEFFDEMMFMYKEDCDLSLRLRLAGWKIVLASKATAHHDRTAATVGMSLLDIALNRRSKSVRVKRWSFFNQWVMVFKFFPLLPLRIKMKTAAYQLASLAFAFIFESYLIREFFAVWKKRPEIAAKRDGLKIALPEPEIEKLFS